MALELVGPAVTLRLLVAAAVLGAFVLLAWGSWIRRASARRWLEAMAASFGFKRKSKETDEELRARMVAHLRGGPPRGSRKDIEGMVAEALWDRGFRRAVVVLSEPEVGVVCARVIERVPDDVLRAIEGELRDRLPIYLALKISAD